MVSAELSHKGGEVQLSRRKHMMPMRPASCADRFVSLLSRFDQHIGREALVLPAREVLSDNRLDVSLSGEIVSGDGSKKGLLPAFA
jgi:hypothetical protein